MGPSSGSPGPTIYKGQKAMVAPRQFPHCSAAATAATKRARTEADALLDNERPATTYLISDGPPCRHWFPLWNRRSPALRGRGFSICARIVSRKAALTLR